MDTPRHYTRRDALGLLASTGACLGAGRLRAHVGEGTVPQAGQSIDALVATAIERNDTAVQSLLQAQITDSASQWRGGVPDQAGLHLPVSAGGLIETLAASFVHPRSRFHRDGAVLERIRLAAGFLERAQGPQGNIDLLTTNFNSPPDTGFVEARRTNPHAPPISVR